MRWAALMLLLTACGAVMRDVPLRTSDPDDARWDDLAPMADAIRDARVVVLGEPRDADREAIRARARLVRWLHETQGFDVLLWEAGVWSTSQMDAAIQRGDEGDVRAIGLPALAVSLDETRSVIDYARSTRTSAHPLHVLGLDINFNAAGALDRYRDWLLAIVDAAGACDAEERAALVTAFGRFPKTSRFAPLTAEDRTHDRAVFAALRARLAEREMADRDLVLQSLDDVDALYRWHEAVHADVSTTIPWDAHVALNEVRDEAMAANVLWQLARAPGHRVIVWVANVHASCTLDGVVPVGDDVPDGALDGYHPMGEHLARALGDSLYVIATTAYGGEVGSPAGPVAIGPAPEGSFEAGLVAAGREVALIDLRAHHLTETALFVGYSPMRADWSRVYDAALFFRTMTPAIAPAATP